MIHSYIKLILYTWHIHLAILQKMHCAGNMYCTYTCTLISVIHQKLKIMCIAQEIKLCVDIIVTVILCCACCICRCESYRCQSVFPALSCSNADTSHGESTFMVRARDVLFHVCIGYTVEIALEMPRYLLQEDESALVDESGACEEVSASNKTSATPHKPPAVSSPTPFLNPHRTTNSPSPFKTTVPHRTSSSTLPHKTSANSAIYSKASTPHPLTTSVVTVEPLQTTKNDYLHGNQLQTSDPQSSQKSVSFSESRRGVEDAPRVSYSWSCDSHLAPAGPLTVCFPQQARSSNAANQQTEGVRLINLHATPISIAPAPRLQPGTHVNNSCERKKRRHGGGWPKGKSRKVDGHVSLPKPPATG